MAGLGLSDAVSKGLNAYGAATRMKRDQQDQSFQDEQRGRLRTQQAEEDRLMKARNEANAAGAAVLAGFEREAGQGLGAPERYMNQGGTDSSMPNQAGLDAPVQQPKPFQPKPDQLLKAYEARGQALARNGDFQGFTENFAKIAPLRAEMRNKTIDAALGAYKLDADIGKLAKTVYSTIDDGKEIADVVQVKGVRQLGADGRVDPAAGVPATFTLKMSDGQMSKPMTAQDMVALAERMRMDPGKVAEYEFKHALKTAEEASKLANKKVEISAQGDENRKTEVVKNQGALGLADVNNTASQKRTDTTAGATLGSARIGADSRVQAANIGASASRYGADKRDGGGGAGGTGARVQSTHVNADGNVVAILRDGSTKVLTDTNGSPIKSGTWSKRVDSLAATLAKSRQFRSMSASDVRAEAERILGSGEEPPAGTGPSLNDATRPGAPKPAPANRPPLDSFFR